MWTHNIILSLNLQNVRNLKLIQFWQEREENEWWVWEAAATAPDSLAPSVCRQRCLCIVTLAFHWLIFSHHFLRRMRCVWITWRAMCDVRCLCKSHAHRSTVAHSKSKPLHVFHSTTCWSIGQGNSWKITFREFPSYVNYLIKFYVETEIINFC